jgi:RNA polymerase sigma factor (sigma-70 family)
VTAEQERELIVRAQAGDTSATAALLKAHEGYLRQQVGRNAGEDFEDLLQEAMLAALEALPAFDVSKGFRFLTFAGQNVIWKLQRVRHRTGLIRTPQPQAYANATEDNRAKAQAARRVSSIDAPLGDGERSRVSLMADGRDTFEDIERDEEVDRLQWAISMLPVRDATVIRARMDGGTMREVGPLVGISRGRIHQIEPKIHEHLRSLLELKIVRPRPRFIARLGNARPVVCDGRVFATVSACADVIGVIPAKVCRAIKDKAGAIDGHAVRYAAADEAPRAPRPMRLDPRARGVVHVRSGEYFHSLTAAANRFGLKPAPLWKAMNTGRRRGEYRGHQFVYAVPASTSPALPRPARSPSPSPRGDSPTPAAPAGGGGAHVL